MDDLVLYEHPLHETIRVCLRLECLFKQADYYLAHDGYWHDRTVVATIVDMVNVLDRPDYKQKLTKRLIRCRENLLPHLEDNKVDQSKLKQILESLCQGIDYLRSITGKISQALEQDEFLNAVRLRLSQAGGARNFDLPRYHYWLNLSEDKRQADIHHWLGHLTAFRTILELYLMLMRQSTQFFTVIAENGYYEKVLDSNTDYQMLRIYLDKTMPIFPDISVGRHRMSLHFFSFSSEDGRPVQFKKDVTFKLALCA